MNFEVRQAIDGYLDLVDGALLKAEIGRARRVGIVRDLECHVLEEVRGRVGEREATVEDVRAALAGLGSPESFAGGTPEKPRAEVRGRRVLPAHVRWGAALLATGLFGLIVVVAAFARHRENPSELLLMMISSTPVVLMFVISGVLGFAGLRRIREQPLRYWGRFFAVVEMAGFPILLMCASPVLFFTLGFTAALVFVMRRLYDVRGAAERFLAEM